MNTKSSWFLLGLVLLAILFVPLIPNDTPITGCTRGAQSNCDEGTGYMSIYQKYYKK